jgi:hypothetical protein
MLQTHFLSQKVKKITEKLVTKEFEKLLIGMQYNLEYKPHPDMHAMFILELPDNLWHAYLGAAYIRDYTVHVA